jgi:hypothetical protein
MAVAGFSPRLTVVDAKIRVVNIGVTQRLRPRLARLPRLAHQLRLARLPRLAQLGLRLVDASLVSSFPAHHPRLVAHGRQRLRMLAAVK